MTGRNSIGDELVAPPAPAEPRWYCVRTRAKSEHLAAARLPRLAGIEAFCPRIKFRHPTRRGPVWFTEAMFPTYIFARFDVRQSWKAVLYTTGVTGIVHFGDAYVPVPDGAVEALRAGVAGDGIRVFDRPFEPGDETTVLAGPFHGLQAVVTRVLPSRERVRILLEFLGRATEAEVDAASLTPVEAPPHRRGRPEGGRMGAAGPGPADGAR